MLSLTAHQLEVFRTVARLGNITRAAKALMLSQPSVSEQVAALERACGIELLERLPRGVRLTEAGEAVYRHAERYFVAAEDLDRALAELRGLRGTQLRVGASMTIGQYVLPEILGAFQEVHPGLRVSLSVGNSREIVDRVLQRELGLGFVGGAPERPDLAAVKWVDDEIVAFVHPNHALAKRAEVTLQELTQHAWIGREPGSATRGEIERTLAGASVCLSPKMELGSNEAVKAAVSKRLGFGLISRFDVTDEAAAGRFAVLTVTDWACRRPFLLCHRRDHRPSHVERAFLRFIGKEPAVD
jgi:DNA-binding transcriptional LysR family regulator